MKKVICKVEYDTDTAEMIMKKTYGNFGDPWGYEESLYRTQDGKYFLYCYGGLNTPYPKELIRRMAADKVEAWQEETRRIMEGNA